MADAKRDTMTFKYLEETATIKKRSNHPNQFDYLIGFILEKKYKFDETAENVFIFQSQEAYNRIVQEASNIGFDFY